MQLFSLFDLCENKQEKMYQESKKKTISVNKMYLHLNS